MPVTIVSGSPGCGKTTVSRLLATEHRLGVHLESDYFFDFLSHKIDPSTPESRAQNETVVRAYTMASDIYSSGGYSVYLDGVIGPWLFPLVTSILPSFDYILLHATQSVALARVFSRPSLPGAEVQAARRMYGQFAEIVGQYEPHVVHTEGKTVDEVVGEIRYKQDRGMFKISAA